MKTLRQDKGDRGANETLVCITAPHFCAGVIAKDGAVAFAAPILRYMTGWTGRRLANYCKQKGWRWEVAPPEPSAEVPVDTNYDLNVVSHPRPIAGLGILAD